jgi:hypothetical protein
MGIIELSKNLFRLINMFAEASITYGLKKIFLQPVQSIKVQG